MLVYKANLLKNEHIKMLKVCSLNPRSVKTKANALSDYVVSNDFDVALTETWLGTTCDTSCIRELVPTGYAILQVPRQTNIY